MGSGPQSRFYESLALVTFSLALTSHSPSLLLIDLFLSTHPQSPPPQPTPHPTPHPRGYVITGAANSCIRVGVGVVVGVGAGEGAEETSVFNSRSGFCGDTEAEKVSVEDRHGDASLTARDLPCVTNMARCKSPLIVYDCEWRSIVC